MDPRLKTSFIPKKNLGQYGVKKTQFDIVTLVIYLLFAVTIVLSVAIFGYQIWLKQSIDNAKKQVVSARNGINQNLFTEITVLDKRLKASRSLLDKHISASALFEILEDQTLVNLRYSKFSLLKNTEGSLSYKLKLGGEAKNLSTIASQSLLFDSMQGLENIEFTNIDQDKDKNVTFDIDTDLNLSLLKYKVK